MDMMAKKVPGLEVFIKWWDDRKSHIFGPFRGAAFPGVNLSKQGNAGWQTPTLRLVHACRNDLSTMMMQQAGLKEFEENEGKSSGRGQSVGTHLLQDQLDQIKVAVDFNNIMDDAEAIRAQAEEAINPSSYMPKKKTTFKPPLEKPKKFITKQVPKGKKGTSEEGEKMKKQVTFCDDEEVLDITEDTEETHQNKPKKPKSSGIWELQIKPIYG